MIRKVRRSWWVIGSKRDIEKRVCHIWWAAMGVCEYWRSPNNSWPVNINYRWLSVSRILALHDLFSIVFKSRCDVRAGNKLWQSMTRSSSFSRHLSHHWRKFSGNVSGNFHPGVPVRISLDSKQWRRVTAAVSFSITDYKLSRYFCFFTPAGPETFSSGSERVHEVNKTLNRRWTSRPAEPRDSAGLCEANQSDSRGKFAFFYGNEALTANPMWVLPLKVFSLWNLHVSPPRVCVDFLWKLQFLAGLVRYRNSKLPSGVDVWMLFLW